MLSLTHQLSEQQLQELDALCYRCKQADNHTLPVYQHLLHQHRQRLSNALYYQDNQLVGFLSIYFFYETACEMTIMVDPAVRRQGIGRELLIGMQPLLQTPDAAELVVSVPHGLNKPWLQQMGCTPLHTECHMQRTSTTRVIHHRADLTLRLARPDDYRVLYRIDQSCFNTNDNCIALHFMKLLQDPHYLIILAEQEGVAVGKAQIRWENQGAYFSDIAVIPTAQHQGIGTALLAHAINYALDRNKTNLRLDVETRNQYALTLYTNVGFILDNRVDYWTITTKKLMKHFTSHE